MSVISGHPSHVSIIPLLLAVVCKRPKSQHHLKVVRWDLILSSAIHFLHFSLAWFIDLFLSLRLTSFNKEPQFEKSSLSALNSVFLSHLLSFPWLLQFSLEKPFFFFAAFSILYELLSFLPIWQVDSIKFYFEFYVMSLDMSVFLKTKLPWELTLCSHIDFSRCCFLLDKYRLYCIVRNL